MNEWMNVNFINVSMFLAVDELTGDALMLEILVNSIKIDTTK